jgi:tRNA(Arg) A34 adenosine deaminase TadA
MEIDFEDARIQALSPGAYAAAGFVHNAQTAAERAVELALRAAQNGTFGVGGLLIHDSGTIVAEATNSVIRSGQVLDPTAHVERQLVDWYFWARQKGLAFPADELTIVTSVDPCAMCTGAILRSGMSALALAKDKMSGVHGDTRPYRIPRDLWVKADQKMKLFAVKGQHRHQNDTYSRCLEGEVPLELLTKAEFIFESSVASAQNLVFERLSTSEEKVVKNADLMTGTLRHLAAQSDQSFRIPAEGMDVKDRSCREQIFDLLADDACAILDNRGRILGASRSAEEFSPARTSVLELIRAYTQLRQDMFQQFQIELPHPRTCSILKLEPDQQTEKLLLEIGALGSFLEGPRQPNPMPYMGYVRNIGIERVRELIRSLPPLYSEVIHLNAGFIF